MKRIRMRFHRRPSGLFSWWRRPLDWLRSRLGPMDLSGTAALYNMAKGRAEDDSTSAREQGGSRPQGNPRRSDSPTGRRRWLPKSFLSGLISGIALVSLIGLGVLFSGMVSMGGTEEAQVSGALQDTSDTSDGGCAAYLKFKEIKQSLVPSGVPDVYGDELGISFDAVQDAINKVRVFGPTYGQEPNKIVLTGADLERYVDIGSQTACEYCCSATTLVREDGVAACGCAHSIMMRGLAAYLIKNHPDLSDEEILGELNTWKATYFPKQTLAAKLQEMEEAGEPGIKELLEEFPEFLPQMVGGC